MGENQMSKEFILPLLVLQILLVTPSISTARYANSPDGSCCLEEQVLQPGIDLEAASSLSQLAMRCIRREYPNKLSHVLNDDSDVQSPETLHPAFYGCFDWHSAVHGHWMLVRIIRLFPELPEADEIRMALDENLTAENVLLEVKYFDREDRKSFERTYGWAWLLKLAAELHGWDDAGAARWRENLEPLVKVIVERYMDFLPRQTYPIRRGVHANTAFGIAFALDYARTAENRELENLLKERSMTYYANDAECPAGYEPGGDDFFSPCLMEADLMRRVMTPEEFEKWLSRFLPGLHRGEPRGLLEPAVVSDRSDPKIVHLDGLNLSRAWCMKGIASVLAPGNPLKERLVSSANLHARETFSHVASGHYEGEHWLASFMIYMLSMD
jgi:hypothetical protein